MGEERKRNLFQNNSARERYYRRFLLRVGWVLALVCLCINCSNPPTAHAAGKLRTVGESATSAPTSGPTRTTITVNGAGWLSVPDGTAVTFGYSTDPSCASAYTAAAVEQAGSMSGGAFSGWFRWPDAAPTATYIVCATIGTTATPAGTYTVLAAAPPQLSISAATFNVGQHATVTGSNFLPPQTSVTLLLQQLNGGTSIILGTITSDGHGAFSQTYTIPNSPTGPVALIASGGGGTPPAMSASVTFIIYVAPTPTPTAAPRPTPTPVPQQQGGNVSIPTSIQSQAMAPSQTPTATPGGQETTQRPGNEFTQSSPPATNAASGGHSWLLIALLAGMFLLLLATMTTLFLRKKRRQQPTRPAVASSCVGDVHRASNWIPAQDPFAKNAPAEQQKADQLTSGYPPGLSLHVVPDHVGVPLVGTRSVGTRLHHQAGTRHESDQPSTATRTTAQATNNLLHDPLLEAIMQQTRSGLFVLPGKGE